MLSVIKYGTILNLEGHPKRTTSLGFTAILLDGGILPIGEASALEGSAINGAVTSSFLNNNPVKTHNAYLTLYFFCKP